MNPSAEKQAQWLSELEDLILAIEDGRIPTGRRLVWLDTIRGDIDHLRDNIFLHEHFLENRAQFMKVEHAYLSVRVAKT